MVRIFLSVLIAVSFVFQVSASTEIGWDDLVPEMQETFDDPFADMPDNQLMSLSLVVQYREYMASEGALSEDEQKELQAEIDKLVDWGVDYEDLLAKRDEIIRILTKYESAINPELDGETVKIPGYLLPLQYDEGAVTEFLLVPYVGACIHTPPPPPNQIVHVHSEYGFVASDLYTPVWVDGIMKTESMSANLEFVDGSSDIPIAYTMDAQEITEYQ